MRNFKLTTLLIVGTVIIQLHITSAVNRTYDGQPNSTDGLCVYYYDSNRYTCDLYNAVISSPDEVLTISGDHLTNRTDSDVQVVIHRNVSISYFNGEVLRKFTNLEYLAMGAAGVLHINENAFDICGKLDHVYIGFNSLETLPNRMLQNCLNLRHLDLYFNGLTSMPGDIFGNTTNLEIFEATNNRLTSLPQDLLQNMRNLKQFSIRSNYITNVDSNLLASAVNLEKVDLSDNPISDATVVTNLLDGHWTLNSIRINRNRFTSFDFMFLSQFTQLSDFEIGGDSSTLIDINWNGLPTSLTSIYLSNIGEIPADAFNHLTNLKSLGFTGSSITNLHEDTFKHLVNLDSLSIQSTGIRTISSKLFFHQMNLTQLYLSFNYIEELPEGLFASLVNLGLNSRALESQLVLSGNRIRRLNANSFGYHPHLTNLELSFNDIAEIDREIFSRFPDPMEIVDLTWNNCINRLFWYESNLRNDERLENCFNNWAGITTTTMAPGSASKVGTYLSLFLITLLFVSAALVC